MLALQNFSNLVVTCLLILSHVFKQEPIILRTSYSLLFP